MTPVGRVRRWWRRRTLHARLSLLVTGAVAAAVVTLSAVAWLAVGEIQHHQMQSQLTANADFEEQTRATFGTVGSTWAARSGRDTPLSQSSDTATPCPFPERDRILAQRDHVPPCYQSAGTPG